jgi:RNA polymerase sigma-70 factor, ECF subfamily
VNSLPLPRAADCPTLASRSSISGQPQALSRPLQASSLHAKGHASEVLGLTTTATPQGKDWMTEAEVDALLVQRVLSGETRAFDLLVRRYQGKIIAAVGRLVRDRTECEDLAQETFLRAYRALGSFRGDSSFYTWLFKIALNTARNFLSGKQTKVSIADLETEIADQVQDPALLRDRATPEREMLRHEIERTVLASVDALPDDIRTALTLREVDGLSYEEIAKVMDCPIGTVRSRIFRAREAVDKNVRPLLQQ